MKEVILVKLKMKKIYKLSLTFIACLILLVSSVGVMYLFYDKVIDPTNDIEVIDSLSINYIDGKSFSVNGNKKIDFSISNSSEEVKYYNLCFSKVRGNGTYRLLYNNMVVNEGSLKTIDEVTTDYISIDALETKKYTIEINSLGKADLKAVLNIRLQSGKNTNFAEIILNNNNPVEEATTKIGDASTIDEGLIKSSDDSGVSYYFRGNVQNNYISLDNTLWRIVRINGDGTVRIVLNNVLETVGNYYTADDVKFNFSESNINNNLENYMVETLRDYNNIIANTRYCNDIGVDNEGNYLSYTRIMTNNIPTLNCLNNPISDSIGLLNIDEVILAGASPNSNNTSYYLYNSDIKDSWYTMSGAMGSDNSLNLFMVDQNGKVRTDIKGDTFHGIRPVINLIKNIEVTGSGTQEDPYQIVE